MSLPASPWRMCQHRGCRSRAVFVFHGKASFEFCAGHTATAKPIFRSQPTPINSTREGDQS